MELLQHSFAHDEYAGPLRRRVRAVLEPLYPTDCVEDVLVVISELVQNVSQHTTGGGNLAVRCERRTIVVEVRDGDATLPRQKRPDDRRPGGRGLLLVAGMAREWGALTEGNGKVVWAEFVVPADASHAVAA